MRTKLPFAIETCSLICLSGLHFHTVDTLLTGSLLCPLPTRQVSVSEVKMVAEEQFGELLAAVRKAQADVMLFLEEKEQAALSQANGIKTHLEHSSTEMEKSRQELGRIAAISNTVLFLEVRLGGVLGPPWSELPSDQ